MSLAQYLANKRISLSHAELRRKLYNEIKRQRKILTYLGWYEHYHPYTTAEDTIDYVRCDDYRCDDVIRRSYGECS